MIEQIRKPLMKALAEAQKTRAALDEGIKAIETALNGSAPIQFARPAREGTSQPVSERPVRHRRPMSAAARKALSARMKRYWAARRKDKKRRVA